MPVLVTGSTGQLGTAFKQLLTDAEFLTRADLDLATAEPTEIREAVRAARPSTVINCAAYTAVDRAEDEESVATRVNGEAVGWLAQAAATAGARFVTYSTDYVFPGDGDRPYLESDPTDPINAYGRSKRVGEQLALDANPSALVIRTSWVISATHRNFVSAILDRAEQGGVRVVDDQRGCPTVASDLAVATLDALQRDASGLLHVTNHGDTTWFELARRAVALAGMDPTLVEPCTSEEFPTRAQRPAYSVLGSERRDPLGVSRLRPWQEALVDVVAGQRPSGAIPGGSARP